MAGLCFIAIARHFITLSVVAFLAVIVLIPALIAGVGAGLLSRMITRWYEQHA